jgi:hypothetical protein
MITLQDYYKKGEQIANHIKEQNKQNSTIATIIEITKETEKYPTIVQKYGLYKYPYVKDETNVAVLTGDIYINGNLDSSWIIEQVKELGRNGFMTLIVGNVIIDGDIIDDDISFLIIKGNLKCNYIYSENGHIDVYGDLDVKYAIAGEYNDGHIEVFGKTTVPYILTYDHQISIVPTTETICIEHCGFETENIGVCTYENLNYYNEYLENAAQLFRPEIYSDEAFDLEKFIEIVKKGENPFIEV